MPAATRRTGLFCLLIATFTLGSSAFAQTTMPTTMPMTADQDHKLMMEALHITSIGAARMGQPTVSVLCELRRIES